MAEFPHQTLAEALAAATVDYDVLRERHKPFIHLGRRFLGIESNIYPYMEIWPTSFRTYNLMVPNFINVPLPLLGIGPGLGLLGTAVFMSSRTAGCMYCSAHGCSLALRGGATHSMLASLLEPGDSHTPLERALLRVAVGMSTVPASLTAEDVADLAAHCRSTTLDWLAHCIAMTGFLNKMMDGMGVDLEGALVAEVGEVAERSGWRSGRHAVVDDQRPVFAPTGSGWRTLLAIAPFIPAAIRANERWSRGIPRSGPKAASLLEALSAYDFPMVARIRQARVVRALTTMLRDNLLAGQSRIGLDTKHAAGVVFATAIGSDALQHGSLAMAKKAGVRKPEDLVELGRKDVDLTDSTAIQAFAGDVDQNLAVAMVLARASASSPSQISPAVIAQSTSAFDAAAVIELVTWFSLLSLLHRLQVFQQVRQSNEN